MEKNTDRCIYMYMDICVSVCVYGASQVARVVKKLPADVGNISNSGSIPGLGRSPGGGNGSPGQYSCLDNCTERRDSIDRGRTIACAQSLQLCPALCDPMDCSPAGSSGYGILQARILERVAISSSRGSS